MLEVQGLSVRYGTLPAVDQADLKVADGQVLALLGPSGCGKSTLLRAVAGLEPPAAGSVRWDGVDLARIPVHRRGFGLMFQDGVLFPHRTVAGNVGYGLRGRGGRAEVERRIDDLLDMVGLAGYGPRRVSTLSGGEAQRVALARALAPRPRLLLLDEPLAALDRSLREHLLADLRAVFTAAAATAIFVTHDQAEAFAIADQVAIMRAGRIVQQGLPREVWGHPADEWTARFLGCAAVIPAEARRDADGSWRSVSALGAIPGRAGLLGLRAAALAMDPAGAVRGRVLSVVAGLSEQRLTVDLLSDDPGIAGSGPLGALPAVARPADALSVGDIVTLRWDPDEVVLVGPSSDMPPADAEGAPAGDAAHTAAEANTAVRLRTPA